MDETSCEPVNEDVKPITTVFSAGAAAGSMGSSVAAGCSWGSIVSAGAGAAGASVGALEPQAERISPNSTTNVRILDNERFERNPSVLF